MKFSRYICLMLFVILCFNMTCIVAFGYSVNNFTYNTYSNSSVYGDATLPYRLCLPDNYDHRRQYPILLFLHGAGERGNDNIKQLASNTPFIGYDSVWAKNECIIVVPQCPSDLRWVDTPWGYGSYDQDSNTITRPLSMALELLNDLEMQYSVDTYRRYIMGISMGGFGTWDTITRFPNRFAAAIPICGGGDPSKANLISTLPIQTFHGSADPTVPVQSTREMVAALRNVNSNVVYTEFDGVDHACWGRAYGTAGLFDWLFKQTNANVSVEYNGSKLNLSSKSNQLTSIVVASYSNDNKIIDSMLLKDKTLIADEKYQFDIWNLNTTNASNIKIMVWNSLANINPLRKTLVTNYNRFNINDYGIMAIRADSGGGANRECTITIKDSKGNLVYLDQITSNNIGEYFYDLKISGYMENETYTVKIGGDNCDLKFYMINK